MSDNTQSKDCSAEAPTPGPGPTGSKSDSRSDEPVLLLANGRQKTPLSSNDKTRSLVCFIEGSNAVFEVNVDTWQDIFDLKELVSQQGIINVATRKRAQALVLSKVNIDVCSRDADALSALKAKIGDRDFELLTGWGTVLDIWPVQPDGDKVHVLVKVPPAADDDLEQEPSDITQVLLSRWSNLTTTLPASHHDLVTYLNKPLDESEKVPVPPPTMSAVVSNCGHGRDVRRILRASKDEEADKLWTILSKAIFCDPPHPFHANTEFGSFVSFWDDNIGKIISAISTPGTGRCVVRRARTTLERTDFGNDLQRGSCTFWGELNPPGYSGKHPKDEFFNKLAFTYHPAPWILGYHAVGAEVTLATISSSAIVDVGMLDLSYRQQRITNILRIIKMVSLLRLLQEMIARDQPEFVAIDCETGITVEVGSSRVTKIYNINGPSRISHLQRIYALLREKDVPNVDSLVDSSFTNHPQCGGAAVAYFEPRGVYRPPTSCLEVQQAVLCLLEALVVLHRDPDPVFHRNIRWSNVVLSAKDPTKWFLVDWDDASESPTRGARHLAPGTHSSYVFEDNHGAEVDIWAVGRLILDAKMFVPEISVMLVDIGWEMVGGVIGTAIQAQARIRETTAA